MVPVCGSHVCCVGERSHQSSSRQHSVKKTRSKEKDHKGKKALKKSTSSEGEVEHHSRKSPKKSTSSEKEVKDQHKISSKKSKSSDSEVIPKNIATTSHDKETSGEGKADKKSKSPNKPAVHRVESETKEHKNVFVAKRVSARSLEENAVYGKYWYHRPPLENVVTHCDEDRYEYTPTLAAPAQEEGSFEKERRSKNSGLCVGCKEPMCLICKHFICNCECNRPNFVICNLCHHKLVPRKKKVCPPPHQKRRNETCQNGAMDGDAMFLLPLLASMQANANCQSCNC
ncbi:hypothetical protein GE061_010864 [Apolygus lucorum]|uniref:Uncharacterized protein n=1 Tax=Apolygus lucorum TaxID=248454 RepID=A0A6A4K4W5_APOLU|nr:hypothetical protein GE061_010864 [Apolygus lucorum]